MRHLEIFARPHLYCAFAFFLAAVSLVRADVRMPSIFGENMVLQRDIPISVWGWAEPGEKIAITLGGKTAETTAGGDGKWKVRLEPMRATDEPVEMKVTGKNELRFGNVEIGDVWVCSGQSNMRWSLAASTGGKEAIAKANHPGMRFFQVERRIAFDPAEEVTGRWLVCKPDTAELGLFSGVGFFFGRDIYLTQKVPVGLIGTYVGGTPAQAWTSLEKLDASPALKHYADTARTTKANLVELKAKHESEVLPKWREEWEKKKAEGVKVAKFKAPPAPDQNGKQAAVLFNGMVNPLIPYGIKGVIWYQGEANANKFQEYSELFPSMIQDWRERWGQGDFPFLFVQLAGYKNGGVRWKYMREAQRKALDLPATAMAVAIDVGEERDIHPRAKEPVGQRLALGARHVAYGENIVFSGPVLKEARSEGTSMVLAFDHTGGGLVVGQSPLATPEQVKAAEGRLLGFQVAGANGKFFAAEARIENNMVRLSSEAVPAPVSASYAWSPWPDPMGNLYNKEGLPAVPFSTRPEPLPAAGAAREDAED